MARRQLLDAGIDSDRITRWLADGRLTRVHRGVYAIGRPAPSMPGVYMAAVLACGKGAVLSHLAAGHLLRVVAAGKAPPPEVTVPTTAARRRPGIEVHRVAALHARDHAPYAGMEVATAPRVLLDIAPRLSLPQLTRAVHEAWIHHRTAPAHVLACMQRNPRRPGTGRLRLALGKDVTLSMLEDGFLALLRDNGLPAARTNIAHAGDTVDCHWPQLGVTIELLSYRFHGSRRAFEDDVARRRRSNHVAFTYGDVFERGAQTARELVRLLNVE